MTSAVQGISIDQLEVSDAWKKKFELMEEAGIKQMPYFEMLKGDRFKALPLKSRHGIMFNFWALLFGVLYYFAKGMWKKGSVILSVSMLINAVLSFVAFTIGQELPSVLYWIFPAVFCAQFANRDYYALKTQGEAMWAGLPKFLGNPVVAVLFPVITFVLALSVVMAQVQGSQKIYAEPLSCDSISVHDTVKEIARGEVTKSIPANRVSEFDYQLSAVVPVSSDGQGEFSCSAQFSLIAGGSTLGVFPITFKVSLQTDGQFYVNVFGL